MRLTDLAVHIVSPPAPGWGGRWWALVKLTTDDGVTGWGECYAGAVGPAALRAVIEDVFARHAEGCSPFDVELIFRRAYSSGFTQRPDPTVMGAFSGIEIACWDIVGRALGRPVWQLAGGRTTDAVRAYTYLYPDDPADTAFYADPDRSAEAAAEAVDAGWTAVKFDPAGPYTIRGGHMPAAADVARCAAFCAAIREAVGDRADILFGTHGQFTPAGALRVARAIARHDPLWLEEPVPPDDPAAMARVIAGTPIPIAAGERLVTKAEFAPLLAAGLAVAQPALGRVGGIGEARKIAAIAEAHGGLVAPHLYAGPVEWAASLHLATAIPNVLMVETIDTDFHRALIGDRIAVEDGHVRLSDAPGLGIEVDEALLADHAHDGARLPLEMQEGPPDPRGGGVALG